MKKTGVERSNAPYCGMSWGTVARRNTASFGVPHTGCARSNTPAIAAPRGEAPLPFEASGARRSQ